MKLTILAAAAVAALALAGCVSTKATVLGTGPKMTAIKAEQVSIYRTPEQVPRTYDEIAILSSTGDSNFTTNSKMYESMRKKAAAIGANGVILDNVREPGSGAKVAALIFGVSAQRKGTSIAINVHPAP
jgi:hypothetical protein